MHGIHGTDHHMIALAKSTGPGLHHLSWDVGSINDVGLGAMQMADKGFTAGGVSAVMCWARTTFHYVQDPWGSWCEYSSTSTTSRSITTGIAAIARPKIFLYLGTDTS